MKKSAFTLLELLIVLALVILGAVLFFPVLNTTMEASRRSRCVANLRHIGGMLHRLVGENRGRFPYWLDNRLALTNRMWQQRIYGNETVNSDLFGCPSIRNRRVIENPSRSNYYYYFASSGSSNYGISDYLSSQYVSPPNNVPEVRLSAVKNPAKTVMLGERQTVLFSPTKGGTGAKSYPSFGLGTHGNGANVMFVDGHLEYVTGTFKGLHWSSHLDDNTYWNPAL